MVETSDYVGHTFWHWTCQPYVSLLDYDTEMRTISLLVFKASNRFRSRFDVGNGAQSGVMLLVVHF